MDLCVRQAEIIHKFLDRAMLLNIPVGDVSHCDATSNDARVSPSGAIAKYDIR